MAGFDEFTKGKFREWLTTRFSPTQLLKMGISDIRSFDIAAYIRGKGHAGNPSAIEDRLFREFVLFTYTANLQQWANIVNTMKRKSSEIGADTPIWGNQFMRTGENVYGLLLSQYMDVVNAETFYGQGLGGRWIGTATNVGLPPNFRLSSTYKLAVAAAGGTKPVWVRGVPQTNNGNTLFLKPNFWKLIVSEAYANSAIRMIEITQITRLQKQILPKQALDELSRYARFFHAQRQMYGLQPSYAKAGVIYSVPTMLWRHFPSTGLYPSLQIDAFHSWARLLEEEHVPYDALIFGHPALWNDSATLASLHRYGVLVLPQIDAMSDTQVQALVAYVQSGGHLVVTGSSNLHDENYEKQPSGIWQDLLNCKGQLCGAGRVWLIDGTPDASFFRETVLGTSGQDKRSVLLKAFNQAMPARPVTTDAGTKVSMNLTRNGSSGLFIHLLNYDINVASDQVRPTTPFTVSVDLPDDARLTDLKAILFNPDLAEGKVDLALKLDDHRATFVAPSFNTYAVVAIYSQAEQNAIEALQTAQTTISNWERKGFVLQASRTELLKANDEYAAGRYDEARHHAYQARLEAVRALGAFLGSSRKASLHADVLDQIERILSATEVQNVDKQLDAVEAALVEALKPALLFDEGHGQKVTVDPERAKQLSPGHPEYVLQILGSGVSVHRAVGSELASEDYLNGFDVLAIYCPTVAFSSTVVEAIGEFVRDGGGLLLIGDATFPCDFGRLGERLGVSIESTVLAASAHLQDAQSLVVTDIARHETTRGVVEIGVNWGASLDVADNWEIIAKTSPDTWRDKNADGQRSTNEPSGPFVLLASADISKGLCWRTQAATENMLSEARDHKVATNTLQGLARI